jgi:hypothetical protein
MAESGFSIYFHIFDWSGEDDTAHSASSAMIEDPAMPIPISVESYRSNGLKSTIKTYQDPHHTVPSTNFKHNDIVYLTFCDSTLKTDTCVFQILELQYPFNMLEKDEASDRASIERYYEEHYYNDSNKIIVMGYDDGTHGDVEPNDGIYSTNFRIQSKALGGDTNQDTSTIAVKSSVFIVPNEIDWDSGQIIYIDSPTIPEFPGNIVLLFICLLFCSIIVIFRRRCGFE